MSDAEPGPSEGRSKGRRRGLLAVLVVVVLVVAVIAVLRIAGSDDDTAGDGGGAGDDAGAGAVPTPPASAPGQGSFIESTVAADGSVGVQQWIRNSTPIRSLDVAVFDPEDSGSARATDVVVRSLDGAVLARRDSVGQSRVSLRLTAGVPNLYLSYRISGGLDSASQTVPGRMLVTVLGMDVTFSGTARNVQRLVTGPGDVTNVACLRVEASADADPRPCGSPTPGGGWLVDLRGIDRSDRLLAQLDSTPTSTPTS